MAAGQGRGRWLRWVMLVGAAGGVAAFASSLRWGRVLSALRSADGGLLALAAALAVGSLVLQSVRWHRVVRPVRPVPLSTVLAASLAGQAASCVLPLRAGEAVRLELLARATGMGRAAALGTLAADHAVNGLVMFALAALAPLALPAPPSARLVAWIGALAVAALALLLLRLARPQNGQLPRRRLGRALLRLREGLLALRRPRAVLGAAAAALCAWLLEIAAAMTALAAFRMQHGLAAGAAVVLGVNVALAAPVAPANLGTFELGAAMALVALGESADSSAAFALGFHALQLAPILLLGGAGLLTLRRRPDPAAPKPTAAPERAAA
jgi:uncharacterized protein (TIRG00374 family)